MKVDTLKDYVFSKGYSPHACRYIYMKVGLFHESRYLITRCIKICLLQTLKPYPSYLSVLQIERTYTAEQAVLYLSSITYIFAVALLLLG